MLIKGVKHYTGSIALDSWLEVTIDEVDLSKAILKGNWRVGNVSYSRFLDSTTVELQNDNNFEEIYAFEVVEFL